MSRHHDGLNRKEWGRLRRKALDRDGWRCVDCGKAGRLEVDHVIPLKDGGAPLDLNNVAARCRDCHFRKTASERRRPRSARQAAWDRYVDSI